MGKKDASYTTKVNVFKSMSSLVNTAFDMDELMFLIIQLATKVTGARSSSLLLVDDKNKKLHFFIASGKGTHKLKRLELSMGEGIAGWVAQEGKPALIPDVSTDSRWSKEVAKMVDLNIRSIACAPMMLENKVIGVIEIIDKKDGGVIDDDDMKLLKAFADMAAALLEKSHAYKNVTKEINYLKRRLTENCKVIGVSKAIEKVVSEAKKVASTCATVLLTGESGTGKELFAKYVHQESLRKDNQMICVNCGALPDSMLERELFGHEQGAFTNADSKKIGLFEAADRGTLFLDEISEMLPKMQVKLLRVLQEGVFFRLGGTEPISTDIRIIAATNSELPKMVAEGTFREDLFYRLNVVNIEIPALRDRREDIPLLVDYFIANNKKQYGVTKLNVLKEAKHKMIDYDWPGNVRELKNVLESAIIMRKREKELHPDDIQIENSENTSIQSYIGLCLKDAVNNFKKDLITRTLDLTEGKKAEAAKILDIGRTHLSKLLKDLGVE